MAQDTFFIKTYGCQMNKNDSEHIAGYLTASGYTPTHVEAEADLVVLNTCSIREVAERRAYGKFHRLNHERKRGREVKLAIAGCMPGHNREGVMKDLPFIDWVIDINEARKYPAVRDTYDTAWVTIQNGCNHFCTYCIVPYSRGQETYRSVEEILLEIDGLDKSKYRGISLLGQNINSYRGKWLQQNKIADFGDILALAHEKIGNCRLEFLTSHPKDMDDKAIEIMGGLKKLHNEILVPAQSGNNRILRRMNRGYTKEFYIDLIKKMRQKIKNVQISTDIIVGFPGETEEEFEETLNLVKEMGFFRVNTAAFSIRPGTPAARMKEQLPEEEKYRRHQKLISVVDAYALKKQYDKA
jgi:tRNA-2-methylthio-N6-dimethylallyladenosine synthase